VRYRGVFFLGVWISRVPDMRLVDRENQITVNESREMAAAMFGELVKAVVDVRLQVMAVDAELQSDEEAFLLERGSEQEDLWYKSRLRELLRVREALADYFVFDNSYHSSDEAWLSYFRFFLLAARGNR